MTPAAIDFHLAAVREARAAYRWYLRRSTAAAGRFRAPWTRRCSRSGRRPTAGPPTCTARAVAPCVVSLTSWCTVGSRLEYKSSRWRKAGGSPDIGGEGSDGRSTDPVALLASFGVTALTPDDFVCRLLDSGIVAAAAAEQRAALSRPALSVDE